MSLNLYLGIAFLFATLATSCYKNKSELKKGLTSQLTEDEIKIYQDIIDNRRNIYLRGLAIGMIVSYFYLRINPTTNSYSDGLSTMAITGVINYFYYILHPKDKYMLEYLDTKKENKAWLDIYRTMQLRWHSAFVLGLITSYFIKDL
jgi:hypothetical protein